MNTLILLSSLFLVAADPAIASDRSMTAILYTPTVGRPCDCATFDASPGPHRRWYYPRCVHPATGAEAIAEAQNLLEMGLITEATYRIVAAANDGQAIQQPSPVATVKLRHPGAYTAALCLDYCAEGLCYECPEFPPMPLKSPCPEPCLFCDGFEAGDTSAWPRSTAEPDRIFADGFESGDVSRWGAP